jgi:hypothetical protein
MHAARSVLPLVLVRAFERTHRAPRNAHSVSIERETGREHERVNEKEAHGCPIRGAQPYSPPPETSAWRRATKASYCSGAGLCARVRSQCWYSLRALLRLFFVSL